MKYPNILKAYIKHQKIYRDTHPNSLVNRHFDNEYENVYFSIFEDKLTEHNEKKHTLFGDMDYKAELERIFNLKSADL